MYAYDFFPPTSGGAATTTTAPTATGGILGTLESIFTRGISAYADSQIARYTGNDPRLYVRDPLTGVVSPQGTVNAGAQSVPFSAGVPGWVWLAAVGALAYVVLRR